MGRERTRRRTETVKTLIEKHCMMKTFKTYAIALLVAGATVTATKVPAAHTDTNTFTNVVQNLSISLTVCSNSPVVSNTKIAGSKPVTIDTKTIITAYSNAAGTIPSLVGFDFGKSPQLVLDTTFAATNTVVTTTNASTNVITATLTVTNGGHIAFIDGSTNVVTISNTTGSATITNNAVGTNAGTNLITFTGWSGTTNFISTNAFTYTNTSGASATTAAFPTNVGDWTVITAATNALGQTNVIATTYSTTNSTNVGYITNSVGVEIQGGTAAAPVYASIANYVTAGTIRSVTLTAAGTNFDDLGTTNATNVMYTSTTTDAFGDFFVRVFNTNASTSVANNLSLNLYGFVKAATKYDVLYLSKKSGITNEVTDTTQSATVSGYGDVGGTFITNAVAGTNSTGVYTTEYYGTNTAVTNEVTGSITNPIPVVVEGTVTIGSPKSVPE
jgi:hypothetical protein